MAPSIQLETYNRIVYARVLEQLTDAPKKSFKETLADFNQMMWFIIRKEGEMKVYAYMQCWKQLESFGAFDHLKTIYKDAIAPSDDDKYSLMLTIPAKAPSGTNESYAMDCSKLLTNMLIAPAFIAATKAKEGKGDDKVIQIDYRPGESYWVKSSGDRMTVIFSIKFDDKDDAVFGRVFVNEFAKGQAGCPSCDVVTRKNAPPPAELKDVSGLAEDNCYISFLFEKRHLANPQKTLEVLMTCRNYINYHIKCSRAFLHIRMRNKVSHLQLVLNRAKPEREVEKKTASGRTFKK
uniref:Arp2/3 complex 34 kDa subunit n=1 Tax=Entamoeba invadens TaxID=33085 RepID=S0B5A1_ENTIV|nr:hypothetical protein, conserved [Entamoeba invadens]